MTNDCFSWRRRRRIAAVAAALIGLSGCGHAPTTGGAAPLAAVEAESMLRSLVAPPDGAVVQMYIDAGAREAEAHTITDQEWALVESALAELPPLHRDILERHLVRLSFIDAPESAGTGLTRRIDPEGTARLFDITLRADVLKMSLSEFLTVKEARLFEDDGSGFSVRVDAGPAAALPYVLLHEATHVVDGVLDVSAQENSPLRAGLWADYRELAAPYDASPVARTPFRREPRIPASDAPALYAALEDAPFVSLYATASAGEDLAELVAWRRLAARPETILQIDVTDASDRLVYRAEPLASPAVRRRFSDVDALLAEAEVQG